MLPTPTEDCIIAKHGFQLLLVVAVVVFADVGPADRQTWLSVPMNCSTSFEVAQAFWTKLLAQPTLAPPHRPASALRHGR